MTSLCSLLILYMSNAHSSQERTARNVCRSRPRDDYNQFLILFLLVSVVTGQGTQEEVYYAIWVLRRRIYTTQPQLLLIPMMFKHCGHNSFWQVFIGIPLLFFLTAPSHFYTHTHTPHIFSLSPSFSVFHTFSPPPPPSFHHAYKIFLCIPIFHRLWTLKWNALIPGIQIGDMFQLPNNLSF